MTRKTDAPAVETRDVAPRWIVYAALGLAALLIVSAGVVAALLGMFGPMRGATISADTGAVYGHTEGPGLELQEGSDRGRLEAAAQAKLTGYAWVDRGAGVARIPIERAMDIVAARGWPPKPARSAP